MIPKDQLVSRSFRLLPATIDLMNAKAKEAGIKQYEFQEAAIRFFDPAKNDEHMAFVKEITSPNDVDEISKLADKLSPDQRQALLERLAKTG